MEEQLTLEKLGGHKYRIHQQWDGTDEMLELLKEKDFQASLEGGMDYYLEIEEEEEHFNFGITMCECFQEMIGNYRFIMDFYHALARNNKDAEFGKQLADTADRIDLLLGIVELLGIENALYLLAKNYTKSLVEQAQRIYQESDESGFVDWLKENVEPRVFLNTEEMLRYLVIPRDIFEGYNAPYAFYISWRFVKNNMSGFVDWQLRNEIATKNPAEVFAYSLLNRSDEDAKMYVLYYWCSRNPLACHLFAMMNSQDVSFGVKSLIRKVLTENGNKDKEFAAQLQHLYDEYRAIIREGVNIIFYETTETDTTAQPTPQIEGPEQEQPKQVPKAMDETSETRQNLFNASVELIEVIVDFIEENYDKKFIVDYFERILINPKYKSDSNKLVHELAFSRSKYEYKGLKVMHFCHIIGFLITKKVIKDNPINLARKIYPKLDKYPEKSDFQNYDDINEKRIGSIRLYIQDAKDFFAGKSRKSIAGYNGIEKVFDDMPKKTPKKPKTA